MIIDRTAAKLQAKQLIRESQPSMLTAALLYTLLTALIGWLSLRLTGVDTNTMNEMLRLASEGNSEAVMEMMTKATPSAGASLIDSLLRLAMAVVGVGFSLFVMNSVRRSQPALGNLLDGFGMFPRVLFLIILQIVFIFLWSLLLVIPGIIAAYRYSFAVYVMIDHPEMSAMDCLRLFGGYRHTDVGGQQGVQFCPVDDQHFCLGILLARAGRAGHQQCVQHGYSPVSAAGSGCVGVVR